MKTIYSVRYDLDVYESNLLFSKVLFLSNDFDEAKKFYDEKVKELNKAKILSLYDSAFSSSSSIPL